jgi:lipoprotein NlpI
MQRRVVIAGIALAVVCILGYFALVGARRLMGPVHDELACRQVGASPKQAIVACTALVDLADRRGVSPADEAPMYVNRGRAYAKDGQYARSRADFDAAIELAPQLADGYWGRATLSLRETRYREAFADYSRAIEIDPDDAGPHAGRGDAAFHLGRYALAQADERAAARLSPGWAGPDLNLVEFAFARGRFADAADHYARAVALSPSSGYAVLELHLMRAHLGRDDRAELSRNAKALDAATWPFPLVAMFLGTRSPAQAAAAAQGGDHRCEAAFYVAEWYRQHHDAARASHGFRTAIATCPHDFVEYDFAPKELRR